MGMTRPTPPSPRPPRRDLGDPGFRLEGSLRAAYELPGGDLLLATLTSLRRIDPEEGRPRWVRPLRAAVLASSEDRRWIFAHESGCGVVVLDAATGETAGSFSTEGVPAALGSRGPGCGEVVVARHDGVVEVVRWRDGTRVDRVEVRDGPPALAVFLRGGRAVLSGDAALVLHDLRTGRSEVLLPGSRRQIAALGVHPDGERAFVLRRDFDDTGGKDTLEWRAGPRLEVAWSHRPGGYARDLELSADGRRLAYRDDDEDRPGAPPVLRVLDTATGATCHSEEVGVRDRFALAPDGRTLAFGFEEVHRVDVDAPRGRGTRSLPGDPGEVGLYGGLAYAGDGRLLGLTCAEGGEDPTFSLVDLEAGVVLARRDPGRYGRVTFLASPDPTETWVGTWTREGSVTVEELAGDSLRRVPAPPTFVAERPGRAPTRELSLGPGADGTLAVHARGEGREVHALRGHPTWISHAAVAPRGEAVALADRGRRVLLVDLGPREGRAPPRVLLEHPRGAKTLAFLPGGTHLAAGVDACGDAPDRRAFDDVLREALVTAMEGGPGIREATPPPSTRLELRDIRTGERTRALRVPGAGLELDFLDGELGIRMGRVRVVPAGEDDAAGLALQHGPVAAPAATFGLPGGRVIQTTDEGRVRIGPARTRPAATARLLEATGPGPPLDPWEELLAADPGGAPELLARDPDGPGLLRWSPRTGARGESRIAVPEACAPLALLEGGAAALVRHGEVLEVWRGEAAEPAARSGPGITGEIRVLLAPDGARALVTSSMNMGVAGPAWWARLHALPDLRLLAEWDPTPGVLVEHAWFDAAGVLCRAARQERYRDHVYGFELVTWVLEGPAPGTWTPTPYGIDPDRDHDLLGIVPVAGGGAVLRPRDPDHPAAYLADPEHRVDLAASRETGIRRAVLDAPGRRLALGGPDPAVRVLDAATGALLHELEVGPGGILDLSWCAAGEVLVAGRADRTLAAWDLGPAGVPQ